MVDAETWEIHYMVLATTNWSPGKSVLISPRWTTRISWGDRRVDVGMSRHEITASPEWTATYPVDAVYAAQLYRHYAGTPGWAARDRNVLATPHHAKGERASSGDTENEDAALESANARVAAHEQAQILAADAAVVRDAREGRMP